MKMFIKVVLLGLVFCISGSPLYAQSKSDSLFFLQKGRLFISPTFSVNNRTADNEDQLFRFVENQNKVDWNVDVNVGYFIKDNFTAGAQLSVGFLSEQIEYVADGQNIYTKTRGETITFSPNIRNYFGSGRLKVFNQTNINFSYGEKLQRVYKEDDEDKIRTRTLNFGIGLQPGIAFFASEMIAVEASLNLLGWNAIKRESITNDNEEEKTEVFESNVDFSVNILTLNIGIGIYLDQINKKK